jgi:hypothetical protein
MSKLELPQLEAKLLTIAKRAPHRKVQAAAIYTLARTLNDMAKAERTIIPEGRPLQLLSQVRKDYKDTEYATKAENAIFEIEHLAIGKVAPDFDAADQNGRQFRLSDYRGKVVVLDFWGFW